MNPPDIDIIPVKEGCDDCPFCAESAFCQHPQRPEGEHSIYGQDWQDVPSPKWCPLLQANALVFRIKGL